MKAKIQIYELTPEYVGKEYGVTRKEWATFQRRIAREIAADRKAGRLLEFKPGVLTRRPRKRNERNMRRK